MDGQAKQLQTLAEASSVDDLFERLEATGQTMRIDCTQRPTMFHFATISTGEVEMLRRITQVIRKGRVKGIDAAGLQFESGLHAMPADALYVDCTASAVDPRASKPIFAGSMIVPQLVRAPLVSFSASLIAYAEAHYASDDEKNALCQVVPFPNAMATYPATLLVNMMNQQRWGQDKALCKWMVGSRLDGFGKLVAQVDPDDAEKMAVLGSFRTLGMAAAMNAQKLIRQGA
jgi:hypothetical protein